MEGGGAEEAISRDKELHPGCNYSQSMSTECSNKSETGDFICETLHQILRLCPNKRPVTIFSKREETDQSNMKPFHIFGGSDSSFSSNFDPNSILADILKHIQDDEASNGGADWIPGGNRLDRGIVFGSMIPNQPKLSEHAIPGVAKGPISRV